MRLSLTFQCEQMVQRQRGEREALRRTQEERWQAEEKARAARTPRGIRGLWGWITGKNRKLRQINEAEIERARTRDRAEKQSLIRKQITERQRIQKSLARIRQQQRDTLFTLAADIAKAMSMGRVPEAKTKNEQERKTRREREKSRDRGPDFDPNQ